MMMGSYPLIRTKWSNEHIMTGVFIVLLLYLLPQFAKNPREIKGFIIILIIGLLIDAVINIIRFKRLVCSVSAGVTTAMLQVLAPGIPLSGRIAAVLIALIIGKHIWGGTGKNPINPAVTGLIFLCLFYKISFPSFKFSLLLVPAILLSIPFIRFRPYAGLGFTAGMLTVLILRNEPLLNNIIVYGVFFWGALVVTDPVTVTLNPIVGIMGGFLVGFIPLEFLNSFLSIALGVVFLNLLSFATDKAMLLNNFIMHPQLRLKKLVELMGDKDFTQDNFGKSSDELALSTNMIIERIRNNDVFGHGGAAFPTYKKINTARAARAQDKHLIINGVECDPGLVHDKWLLKNHQEEICEGIEILKKCIEFKSVTLAVKEIRNLNYPKTVNVVKVPDYYPAGAERLLIKSILKKEISQDIMPAELGILVLNVQTVFSIYEAVIKNKKAETKFITAANLKNKSGIVARVKLGARVYDIIKDIYKQNGLIYCGGGAMESHQASEDEVIDKRTNFIALSDFPDYKESPQCSKCGACVLNCPSGLKVNRIADLVEDETFTKLNKYSPERCISCSSCSYVCPAGRNLSARIKNAKEIVKNFN